LIDFYKDIIPSGLEMILDKESVVRFVHCMLLHLTKFSSFDSKFWFLTLAILKLLLTTIIILLKDNSIFILLRKLLA